MERDNVLALDFDPTVVGIASQPFWLSWRDEAGKLISHAPDGAVNLAGAQRDRGVQGLGGLGVGGMGQAAAVSPVTSFQVANRRVISVR
jgi:hypothetical protein